MATLKTISAALKLIDTKKENLKKAYDELQSQSPLLASFSLSWSELDSYFTSIQNSLTQRFHHLESLESQQNDPQLERGLQSVSSDDPTRIQNPNDPSSLSRQQTQNPKGPSSSSIPQKEANLLSVSDDPSSSSNPPNQNVTDLVSQNYMASDLVMPRYDLSVFCEKMDGKGLRKYIVENLKDRSAIQAELPGALRCALDPAAMILDSLDGFHRGNSKKDTALRKVRRSCMLLLQQLRALSPNIGFKVREKAKKLAAEWKGSLMTNGVKSLEALGFLHFVVAYGLLSECSMDELVDFSAMAATNEEVPHLCRIIGLEDKVPDLVQKLVDKGKHVLAVKYVLEFNLAYSIPPVPILKACVDESKKLAKRICQEGNNSLKSLTEATAREIHALKSVIKVIECHNLDSEYPRASLEQRIEQLEKQKTNRKRPAPASAAKPKPQPQQPQSQHQQQQKKKNQRQRQKQQQQSGHKRPQTSAPVGLTAVQKNVSSANSTLHQYQQPLVQPTGLLPEHLNPYSPAMPYGMVGAIPTISPYTGPSAGPYGFAGVPMGSSGNPCQGGSQPYLSEPHVPSGCHDRITNYGGHGLQHYYHTSYYPQ